MITVHNGETELSIQLPSSHPLTAPVHPPERVTGPSELHHSKGRYRCRLTRSELFSQCARLLLHQWKTEQAFEASPELAQAQLDGKDKLGLMKRIASTLQAGADGAAGNLVNLIEEAQLERTLSEGLQGMCQATSAFGPLAT